MVEEKENKKKERLFLILKGVLIVLIVVVGFFLIKSEYFKTNYLEPTIKPVAKSVYDPFKEVFNFMFGQLSSARETWANSEEAFSLEGKVEERKKTGIEIGELKGLFGKIGVGAEIKVFGFGGGVEEIEGSVECSLKSKFGNEIVETESKGFNIRDGRFRISNFEEDRNFLVNCVFSKDEVESIIQGDEGDVEFKLRYLVKQKVNLEVFVSPGKDFEEEDYGYYIESDSAFKELENKRYSNYKSKVPSEMKYVDVVEAKMNFVYQPLFVGKKNTLIFNFENKDKDNKVEIKEFSVKLPEGIEFRDCESFDDGKLKDLDGINKKLNRDDRKSENIRCDVIVKEDAVGGSSGQIVPVDNVVGNLEYEHILKEKKTIMID